MKRRLQRARSVFWLTGVFLVGGCPEKEPPPPELPIISAPLFRDPSNDDEARNADELRAALREGHLGVYSLAGAFPADDWELIQAAYGTPRPADLRGRPAYFEATQYRLLVYDWIDERAAYVPVVNTELPVELCVRRESPYGFVAEWLTARHIEVLSYCGDDPLYHRFIFDTETGAWTERPQTWTAYFADDSGVYTYDDGLVTLPDGSTNMSSILNATFLSANFVISYGGQLQNFRTGELFDLGGLSLNPSRTRALVRSEAGYRVYNLESERPMLLLEFELPAAAPGTFKHAGWFDDDRWIAAGRGYCVESFYLPDCDNAPLLIDTLMGKVYEIDIAGGVPLLFRTIP